MIAQFPGDPSPQRNDIINNSLHRINKILFEQWSGSGGDDFPGDLEPHPADTINNSLHKINRLLLLVGGGGGAGPTGPTGPAGDTGPTGATGPRSGVLYIDYIYQGQVAYAPGNPGSGNITISPDTGDQQDFVAMACSWLDVNGSQAGAQGVLNQLTPFPAVYHAVFRIQKTNDITAWIETAFIGIISDIGFDIIEQFGVINASSPNPFTIGDPVTVVFSLIGTDGATGPEGPTGPAGVTGPTGVGTTGATGPAGDDAGIPYSFVDGSSPFTVFSGQIRFLKDLSGTSLTISDTDLTSGALSGFISTWRNNDFLTVVSEADPSAWALFRVTGTPVTTVDPWYDVSIANVANGPTQLTTLEQVRVLYTKSGPTGPTGSTGPTGPTWTIATAPEEILARLNLAIEQ